MIQSSFWRETCEVVFLTSEKEMSETTEVRDEVLESARASYKADQEKKWTAERERYHADPEKKRSSAKRESYQARAEPEKKQTAERERYQADPEKKRSAKGNVIWRVLNVLAWRRECGTGRLSVVPCKTNEAIEKVLPTKLFKGM